MAEGLPIEERRDFLSTVTHVTYDDIARLTGLTYVTLRNKVSRGLFPRPDFRDAAGHAQWSTDRAEVWEAVLRTKSARGRKPVYQPPGGSS